MWARCPNQRACVCLPGSPCVCVCMCVCWARAWQLALRFPGDFCPAGTAEADFEVFERLRKHWHIDGLPNNSNPGVR